MKTNRVIGLTAVLTTAGALAVPVGQAAAGQSAASGAQVIRATAHVTHGHQTDVGRKGGSAGDQLQFGGTVTGGLSGAFDASCTNTSRTRQTCLMTFRLANGSITAQADYGRNGTSALTPITGGSGAYANASGDLHEQERQGGRIDRLAFHLSG